MSDGVSNGSRVHTRLNEHDRRLSTLERWKERVMGAISMLAFILGSAGLGALALEFIL